MEKFKAMVEAEGTVSNVDEWGKRRLAYPINDLAEGYYVLMNFESKPEFPAELERVMKITEGVLRCLTTVVAEYPNGNSHLSVTHTTNVGYSPTT